MFDNIYSQINDHTRQLVKIRDNVHNDKMIDDKCRSLIKQPTVGKIFTRFIQVDKRNEKTFFKFC